MSKVQTQTTLHANMPRPRRKSGSLGADLPGDNSGAALSTLELPPSTPTPPLSPVSSRLTSLQDLEYILIRTVSAAHLELQIRSTRFQTAKSTLPLPALERFLTAIHMGDPIDRHNGRPLPLCHQSKSKQPPSSCHLPVLSSCFRRPPTAVPCPTRSHLLWQRPP